MTTEHRGGGYRIRGAVFAFAAVMVVLSAFVFSAEVCRWVVAVLQLGFSLGMAVYGLMVARRTHGASRWWRVLAVAAVLSLAVGELTRWGGPGAASVGVVFYFSFLVLALAAVLVLAQGVGGVTARWFRSSRTEMVTIVLDGLVATVAFAILAIMGGLGVTADSSLPRSGGAGVEIAYAVGELILVVIAATTGMFYAPERPCRANYLLLGCGVVMIAATDRVLAYIDSVGGDGSFWGIAGLVLGPLLIAFSMREGQEPVPQDTRLHLMDWAQVILPYIGFLGATLLVAYHRVLGHHANGLEVAAIVVMVVLVSIRQVIAVGAQRVLNRRLYEAQRTLAHQVLHDSLTGLPNRLYFSQRLDEAMQGSSFVLIFVDLDDFKEVNDRFGHAAGDDLLCAVGDRLARCVAKGDMLARIGGDEFAILVGGESEQPDLVAERLRVALREPFAVHGSSVRVRASMGLVRPGVDGAAQTSDDLLRQADISMYAGKRLGKDTAIIYQPSAGVDADFPTALRRAGGGRPRGFGLVYQPIVELPGRVPVALEALARWTAPNGIHIPPQTFVAVAEAAGLGAALDATVLDIACTEVQQAGLDADIHVNIGAARLGNVDFERRLLRILARHGVEPKRLVVEITETVPIVDLPGAAAQIKRLHGLGIRVALDDFGAGYNSLTYLHSLPVHVVKIDRSLATVSDLERDLALYRSVVQLCADLDIDVIAEGIESTEQVDRITAAGCRLAQGHLFGWPTPIGDVVAQCQRSGWSSRFASDPS